MFSNAHISKSQITFSRWSRKGYAIFASLNKIIRIGFLKTEIYSLCLLKSIAAETGLVLDSLLFNENEDEHEVDLAAGLLVAETFVPVTTQAPAGPERKRIRLSFIASPTLLYQLKILSLFKVIFAIFQNCILHFFNAADQSTVSNIEHLKNSVMIPLASDYNGCNQNISSIHKNELFAYVIHR